MALSTAAAAALAEPPPPIPVDQIPVPVSRTPAAAPAALAAPKVVAPAGSKIVILPFESLGDTDRRDWVPRAVQESFSTEAARLGGRFIFSAPAPVGQTIDTAAARDAAKTYDGDFVIFGACQFVNTDIRLTGQIIDVRTGESVAGLKANGDLRDLFELEDQLTVQMSRALRPPPPVAVAQANNSSAIFTHQAPPLTADDLFTPFDQSVQNASAYNRYYYASPYPPYLNGGYGYGYFGGYYGSSLIYTTYSRGGFHGRRNNYPDLGLHPYRGAN